METVALTIDAGVARVTLDRAERHNAFNETVVAELTGVFSRLASERGVRVVVLEGRGPSFSAGADLEWMRAMGAASPEENRASAARMASLFEAIDRCPRPVVARVQGPALGGGCGLVCAVDLAVAGPKAIFGFTEVRLGLLPAVISPYALRRLGESQARARFLTGSRFGAEEALRIGMVHSLAEDLDAEVDRLVQALLAGSPEAQAGCKDLVRELATLPRDLQGDLTVDLAAASRASASAREGMSAFLEHRRPSW